MADVTVQRTVTATLVLGQNEAVWTAQALGEAARVGLWQSPEAAAFAAAVAERLLSQLVPE